MSISGETWAWHGVDAKTEPTQKLERTDGYLSTYGVHTHDITFLYILVHSLISDLKGFYDCMTLTSTSPFGTVTLVIHPSLTTPSDKHSTWPYFIKSDLLSSTAIHIVLDPCTHAFPCLLNSDQVVNSTNSNLGTLKFASVSQ